MPHMLPEYDNSAFFLVTLMDGETAAIPEDVFNRDDYPVGTRFERVAGSWWARLSAPGFLDATEWGGPFDTESEARAYIEDTYEVDADTGATLPESTLAMLQVTDVRKLRRGDIIRHKTASGDSLVVTDTLGDTAIAVRTTTITHADEWLVLRTEEDSDV